MEELFKNVYVDNLFINDKEVLYKAAVKSGIPEEVAKKFKEDENFRKKET